MNLVHEKLRNLPASAIKTSAYCLLLCLFAFNLSSHTFAFWPGDNWWLRSLYWLLYLSLNLTFIFGTFKLLSASKKISSPSVCFAIAVLISWIPFGLAISMLDLSLGRAHSFAIHNLQTTGFIEPLFFKIVNDILPRHLSFGALLFIIHFHLHIGPAKHTLAESVPQISAQHDDAIDAPFLRKLPKKARSLPKLLQAQEHYTKVITASHSELILYKFGQAINELPSDCGHQIHRSFWVSKDNVIGWFSQTNGIHLKLHYGDTAPVSRRFEHAIKTEFPEIP